MPSIRRPTGFFVLLYLLYSLGPALRADSYLNSNLPTTDYGDVDQYASSITAQYDNQACVPTSQTNALIFLENTDPSIVGSSLTGGTSYNNYLSTVLALGADDATNKVSGTYYIQGTIGLHNYLSSVAPTLSLNQSAYYSTDLYGAYGSSVPNYISFQDVSANTIYSSLSGNNAIYLGLSYSNNSGVLTSGGHSVVVEGITWDLNTNTGSLSFIDPLDPGANYFSLSGGYAGGIATAPVLTTGTLKLDPTNSNLLLLSYEQYEQGSFTNGLPPQSDYSMVNTVIGYSETLAAPIPEPSTFALLLLGVALIFPTAQRFRRFQFLA